VVCIAASITGAGRVVIAFLEFLGARLGSLAFLMLVLYIPVKATNWAEGAMESSQRTFRLSDFSPPRGPVRVFLELSALLRSEGVWPLF
jgi:hypothetical protein